MNSLLPLNTRIRLKLNPEITGKIVGLNHTSSGYPSILPYKVKWDDEKAAEKIIGSLYYYPPSRYLEEIK